jgi:hypothetical protein
MELHSDVTTMGRFLQTFLHRDVLVFEESFHHAGLAEALRDGCGIASGA